VIATIKSGIFKYYPYMNLLFKALETSKIKVKQSHYRPGQAQRVPGS